MLTHEQAQERLKAFQVNDAARLHKHVKHLSSDWRAVGFTVLGCDETGESMADRDILKSIRAIDRIFGATDAERRALFYALFGQLSLYVDLAWQLYGRLPYQYGYTRKAFRAQSLPQASVIARWNWLRGLVPLVFQYDQPITWFAQWASHLGYYADSLGILFAAAINNGGSVGNEVFNILVTSAKGEHEIGMMGRHVTRALLVASRPDGWEFVERLLLAAQREEGLRQVILETVDEAHPEAFRRMLRLIAENDLARFAAVTRAVDVWFGFGLDSASTKQVNEVLQVVSRCLEDQEACEVALRQDAQTAYLALWSMAFEDALAAVPHAQALLGDADVERRFIAAHLLAQMNLAPARLALIPALDDEDLRVAVRAYQAMWYEDLGDPFDGMVRLLVRCPKEQTLQPIVWPWMTLQVNRQVMTDKLVDVHGERSPLLLLPHASHMSPRGRYRLVVALGKSKQWNDAIGDALLNFAGDTSSMVRKEALSILQKCTLNGDADAMRLEECLTRKASDLRQGVLSVLLNQPDEVALGSTERLLKSRNALQRSAGLELLNQLVQAKRATDRCRALTHEYGDAQANPGAKEQTLLESILAAERKPATLDDALGLIDLDERTKPVPLQAQKIEFVTANAAACLYALDDLIDQHRDASITVKDWRGERQELLGTLTWGFPSPDPKLLPEEDIARLPLREVWEEWWANRPTSLRDRDRFELLRIAATFALVRHAHGLDRLPKWLTGIGSKLCLPLTKQLRYSGTACGVINWLLKLHPPEGAADFLLDAVEHTCTLVPQEEIHRVVDHSKYDDLDWRDRGVLWCWLQLARQYRDLVPSAWQDAHRLRLWHLLHWVDQPFQGAERSRPYLTEVLEAYRLGGATDADIIDHLLGPQGRKRYSRPFYDMRMLTRRKPPELFGQYPRLRELVDRCRKRIIEVELARGDMPTAASDAAVNVNCVWGVDTLIRLLRITGREGLSRNRSWYDPDSKTGVISHLVHVSFPTEGDTPESFTRKVREARIPAQHLVELAVFAPQWADYVEYTLEWPQLAEAVWWVYAHTKDTHWSVGQDIREVWTAQVSERTPISSTNLMEGAVDVAWFHRTHQTLGDERWQQVYEAAKFAASGTGHARAKLFADAMLGKLDRQTLAARITAKRNQDAVRALGLIPLPSEPDREADVLERYQLIQEFLRSSRKFGGQRQASEKLAASIAMENLARTAGYPDPVRLEWAMEAREVADLAAGPLHVAVAGVTVTLAIDDLGQPVMSVTKGEKALKAIPPAIKKNADVAAMVAHKHQLEQQTSRMRRSLEQAMCRGDSFSGADMREMFQHPVLAPMLSQLVFVSTDVGDPFAGYPVACGQVLQSYDGTLTPLGKGKGVRIAHPHDLLMTKAWHEWQHECFTHERVQPFKQVFRELYVLTRAEQDDKSRSQRYAGQQVQLRQAMALLASRGWVAHPEEGIRRTFHELELTASLDMMGYTMTPADVDSCTIECVSFHRRGEWKPLELVEVPPRVFSEVMRDVDLVVSVAHRGGVDPEATASTVEMRTQLVNETCALLKLENVRVKDHHALIDGQLGHYSVHLGSATVHRMPGGAVCIVPVHAQHRGRLFLPFVDDDPKTAEVMSKVLLLAKDHEIKDPTILEQIV